MSFHVPRPSSRLHSRERSPGRSVHLGHSPPLLLLVALAMLLAACTGSPQVVQPQRHTPTPTSSAPASMVYVALGASDALGVGANDPMTQGYVPILISRLPHGAQALNVGVSGITLHSALQQELPQAVAARPTLVTVWLVGNDFRDCVPLAQYGADLDTLLLRLHDQTHARVFVANAPDFSLLPYFQQGAPGGGACVAGQPPAAIHAQVQQWDQVIDASVARHGDVLVNLFTSDLATHPEFVSSQDGFHPSSAGYAELANLFWAQITAQHAVPGT
jgi:acyl-CoA thioesterase-1